MDTQSDLRGRNVLVVEDSLVQALGMVKILETAGANVYGPVATAAVAATIVQSSIIDVALVDINLGNGPDFGLVGYLRERDIPVILATAYDATEIPKEFREYVFLQKPFRGPEVIAGIQQACVL